MAESIESNFVSIKPAVEFSDTQVQYSYNEDLHCKFKCNDYTPQEGDRVAIFKLGWSFVKEYQVFEWAPVGTEGNDHCVIFNRNTLPKNTIEIYQMCYISGENELHGASSPFQFCSPQTSSLSSSVLPSTSTLPSVQNITKPVASFDNEKYDEIKILREENALLRESLKTVLAQRNDGGTTKNYDKDISDLKEITDRLTSALTEQQKEINMLKIKITEGGEEYKKLYLEKIKVDRKYEKLKNKKEEIKPTNKEFGDNFDIGEWKSIPPFPSWEMDQF